MGICLETISKTNPDEDEHAAFCLKWLSSVSRYAFNNVEEFISDIYASHILRTSMQCLSGIEVDMLLMKSYRSRRHLDETTASDALPKYDCPEFVSMLRDFGERFAAWPQLHGILSFMSTTIWPFINPPVQMTRHGAFPGFIRRYSNSFTLHEQERAGYLPKTAQRSRQKYPQRNAGG